MRTFAAYFSNGGFAQEVTFANSWKAASAAGMLGPELQFKELSVKAGRAVSMRQQQIQSHSSLGNKSPAEASRALELLDGIAVGELATHETDDYQAQGSRYD